MLYVSVRDMIVSALALETSMHKNADRQQPTENSNGISNRSFGAMSANFVETWPKHFALDFRTSPLKKNLNLGSHQGGENRENTEQAEKLENE